MPVSRDVSLESGIAAVPAVKSATAIVDSGNADPDTAAPAATIRATGIADATALAHQFIGLRFGVGSE